MKCKTCEKEKKVDEYMRETTKFEFTVFKEDAGVGIHMCIGKSGFGAQGDTYWKATKDFISLMYYCVRYKWWKK